MTDMIEKLEHGPVADPERGRGGLTRPGVATVRAIVGARGLDQGLHLVRAQHVREFAPARRAFEDLRDIARDETGGVHPAEEHARGGQVTGDGGARQAPLGAEGLEVLDQVPLGD